MYPRITRILIAATLLFGLTAFSQTNSTVPSASPSAQPAPAAAWPTVDGTTVLPNFRFGTGETLPELKLHYLTLGTPHRNAPGTSIMQCYCCMAPAAAPTRC